MEKLFYTIKSKQDLPSETWVDVYGFDGLYEVSNKGRIRSLDRLIYLHNGERMIKGKVLSQCKIQHGNGKFSLYVRLANGNRTYSNKTMASLILNSFKKPDKYNDQIHHINGDSSDNRIENLTFEDIHTKRRIEYDLGLRDGLKCTNHWKESGHLKESSMIFKSIKNIRKGNKSKTYEKRNKKPITVYISKNKFIGSYTCIKNASEQLGIKDYTIRNALLKPNRYKYIQVKYGTLDINSFKPENKKRDSKIIIGNIKYGFMQFADKFNIPFTTMYYKYKNLSDDDFKKWIVNKSNNKINISSILIEKRVSNKQIK